MEAYSICQSCDMPMNRPELMGSEKDQSKSTIYCSGCYQNGDSIPGMSILIKNGKIVKIAPAGVLTASGSTQIIDASGKYAVPGFLNMHMHVVTENENPSTILNLMLANGITGFRQMSGSDVLLKRRSEDSLPIAPDQPALLAMPGEILLPTNRHWTV